MLIEGELFHLRSALSFEARAGIALLYNTLDVGDGSWTWITITDAALMFFRLRAAEDRPEWFPHGKWATIQALETAIDRFYKKPEEGADEQP